MAVLFAFGNDNSDLPAFLDSLACQSRPAGEVHALDYRTRANSSSLSYRWENQLNLKIHRKESQPGGKILNSLLRDITCEFILYLGINYHPAVNYIRTITGILAKEPDLTAARGTLKDKNRNSPFKKAAGLITYHRLSLVGRQGAFQRPEGLIYRKEKLVEAGGWRDCLTFSAQIELLNRLQNKDHKIKISSQTDIHFSPPANRGDFFVFHQNKGRELGELAGTDFLPSLKHWKVDRFFTLWSFALCWNPAGWGLALLYQLLVIKSTFSGIQKFRSAWRAVYLLPLLHLGCWLGWLEKRFTTSAED